MVGILHSSGRWRLPGTKTALVLVKDQLRLPPHLLCHIHLEGFNHAMALLHDGSIGSFLHLSRDETMLITLIRCPILNDDCFGACHGYSTLFEISSSLGYGRSRASRSDAGRREVFVVVVIFGDKTVLDGAAATAGAGAGGSGPRRLAATVMVSSDGHEHMLEASSSRRRSPQLSAVADGNIILLLWIYMPVTIYLWDQEQLSGGGTATSLARSWIDNHSSMA